MIIFTESLFSSVALKIIVDVLMKFHITNSTFSDNIFMLKHTKYIFKGMYRYPKTHIYQKAFTHYMHDKRNIDNIYLVYM